MRLLYESYVSVGRAPGEHPGFGEGLREPGDRFSGENLTFHDFSKIEIFHGPWARPWRHSRFFNIEAGFAKLWGNFGLILSLVYTEARAKRIQESGEILEKVENYPT